jgi:periodic tryptophan protein 1
MMATCSTDEYIKIWDIAHNNGTEPKLIGHKKTTMGELFSLSFYKDIPWVLAAGGSKGEVAVWDTEENEGIGKHFSAFVDKTKVTEKVEDDEDDVVEEDEDSEEEKKPVKNSNKPAK